ncbi:MAG TPA: AAA family ATPase, partial [Fibrobacteraceae bacterium]|nr:AAA family ATPase [Fibrobacteraceae bacterium]
KSFSPYQVTLRGPLTTLVGPNGSGKTQLLRSLKKGLQPHANPKKVRYISAGRLAGLEGFRSDIYGQNGGRPSYQDAVIGQKHYAQTRLQSESAMGDFFTLDVRPDIQIKVSERLRKLFHRDVFLEWDGGQLKVFFAPEGNVQERYSSAQEASGLLHLVSILAALYDDEVGFLLLDEPEVSLHPQLQAFVLQEIKRATGDPAIPGKKVVIIATHSSIMIDVKRPADLCNFIFCQNIREAPVQIDPNAGELKAGKVKELVARLGQEHKNAFFAKQVLLVEGPSDMILAKALDQKCEIFLEPAGTQIVPIIGKGETAAVCKLFRLMGKRPVSILDADAFTDSEDLAKCFAENPEAIHNAQGMGHSNLNEFLHEVYSDFCQAVKSNWSSLYTLVCHHPGCPQINCEDKDQRRGLFAPLLQKQSFTDWPKNCDWSGLQSRLIALLDVLNVAGCFFLRKGAIEQYYLSSQAKSEGAKPTAAVAESEFIQSQETSAIEGNYKDFIAGLRFAGETVALDETGELCNYLLAAVGPILSNEKKGSPEEPNSLARRLIKEKSSLFHFQMESLSELPVLKVELTSKIMSVSGFPLEIPVNQNPDDWIRERIRPFMD